jgi:hypothetical protein
MGHWHRPTITPQSASEAVVSEPDIDGDLRGLDGKILEIAGEVWCIVLFSVRFIGESRQVQLLLVGAPTFAMNLDLPWIADEVDVLSLITDWLAQPGDRIDSMVAAKGRFVSSIARSPRLH